MLETLKIDTNFSLCCFNFLKTYKLSQKKIRLTEIKIDHLFMLKREMNSEWKRLK